MRAIVRIDADPPDIEGCDKGGMFATMLGQMRGWLEDSYPEWMVGVSILVGYEDSQAEAQVNLDHHWVTVE